MSPHFNSNRSTPKVKDGKVQKKNRWTQSPNYYCSDFDRLVIERRNPGKGFRHILTREDVERFVRLVPEWNEIARGLNAILLGPGGDADGYHVRGVVEICAWPEDLWETYDDAQFITQHMPLYKRLGIPTTLHKDG